jgi:hypothetical protein
MKATWKNRDKKSKLTGGILSPVFKMKQSPPYTEHRILMRKRKVFGSKSYEALLREVAYLKELHRLVEWAMEDHRSTFSPEAYIATLDQGYVSGKDTRLEAKELTRLITVAQAEYTQSGYIVLVHTSKVVVGILSHVLFAAIPTQIIMFFDTSAMVNMSRNLFDFRVLCLYLRFLTYVGRFGALRAFNRSDACIINYTLFYESQTAFLYNNHHRNKLTRYDAKFLYCDLTKDHRTMHSMLALMDRRRVGVLHDPVHNC